MNKKNNRDPRTEEAEVVNEEVNCVSREEVKNALRRMKKAKAVGLDEFPVEVWKCMGEMGIKFLTRLFNRLLMGERIPEEWRRSVLIPICKNKGDAQCCGNYKGIKLMSRRMKVRERIIEARLRDRVEISKQQYGRRRRRLKGIHSRPNTNRTGADGLSFYYPRPLHRLDQMLAVMSLSQHRVSSSKTYV